MKTVTFFLMTFFSINGLCMKSETKLSGNLPMEYKNVHREGTLLQEERMIAGNFESKKKNKLTYRDTLRQKLKASPGFYGF